MEWTVLDKEKIPQGEILAANFKPKSYGYKEKLLGYLYYDETEEMITCESGSEVLENCTHYIDLSKYDI